MKLPQIRHKKRPSSSDYLYNFFATISGLTIFNLEFFKQIFIPPYEIGEIKTHMDELGVKTFPIVSITGFIIGLVLALQSLPVLERFGATDFLPATVSRPLLRTNEPQCRRV